jgi:hypothetical protein
MLQVPSQTAHPVTNLVGLEVSTHASDHITGERQVDVLLHYLRSLPAAHHTSILLAGERCYGRALCIFTPAAVPVLCFLLTSAPAYDGHCCCCYRS